MNIIINRQKLQSALGVVEKIISKNVSLPILNTILLKTENGRLKLSATNLEMGIKYWVGAKINKEGEVAVPARVFSDFISNVNDEKLNLSVEKNVISINSEHYKTQILGLDTKEYPILPKAKNAVEFKIASSTLKNSLASVFDSSSLSETRPEIAGVLLNVGKNKAEFAATDSFRLAEKIIDIRDGIDRSMIIPRTTALELMRISEGAEQELTLAVADNQLFVSGEDFEFVSRLIDGHYPEYKKVIPERFVALAKVDKAEFERNIRMASVFSSNVFDIKLKAAGNLLQIKAQNNDRGEILTNIPCLVKDGPFEVSVNYHYLLDGIKSIPTANLIIQFTGDGSPLVLKGEEKKDQTYIIMPLRG
jgi:DNA polymerase-3 subunit beta